MSLFKGKAVLRFTDKNITNNTHKRNIALYRKKTNEKKNSTAKINEILIYKPLLVTCYRFLSLITKVIHKSAASYLFSVVAWKPIFYIK